MKNLRIPFIPVFIDGYVDVYEFINTEQNIFYNSTLLKEIKNIIQLKLQMEETTDNILLQSLRQKVILNNHNASLVNNIIKPLLKRAFEQIHWRYRLLLWGAFNPCVPFNIFMNQYNDEIVYKNNDIQQIRIPKHGGNICIDRVLKKWILFIGNDVKNYGYSSLAIIKAEGKSLHQFGKYYISIYIFTNIP